MAKKSVVSRIDKNLARRLHEARREVGLSTRRVSEMLPRRIRVSHATISSYEKGVTVPPVDVLGALGVVYKRPINWFLDSRESLSNVRYLNLHGRPKLADQRQYAAQAGKWAEAYFALDSHLRGKRASCKVPDLSKVSPEAWANLVRTECLNLDDGDSIDNTVEVLEGFETWVLELRASFGIDGIAANHGDRCVLTLNPTVSNERARLNAAREVAIMLFRDHDPAIASTEFEARTYAFATSLLLPESQLIEAFNGRSFLKLIKYKEAFGVSLAAMIHRAECLRIVNSSAARWLWSTMAKKGWRKNEPGYVWRDRAISFEMMLETAIQTKQITWEEAARITSITEIDLKQRIENTTDTPLGQEEDSSEVEIFLFPQK